MKTANRLLLGIRVVSESNRREHWAQKSARRTEQQTATLAALMQFGLSPKERAASFANGATVTLTKIGGKRLDSHDNLRSAFKACADAVARWIGIDDGDARLTFVYDQEPGGDHDAALWIEAK